MSAVKAATLLEAVARTRDARKDAEAAFRDALRRAHRAHSWREIANVAGMSVQNVRYLTLDLDQRRKWNGGGSRGTAEANHDGS